MPMADAQKIDAEPSKEKFLAPSPSSTFAPDTPMASLASPAGTWASLSPLNESAPKPPKGLATTCPAGFGRGKQPKPPRRCPSSPLAVRPPFRGPKHPFISKEVDIYGFPNIQLSDPKHTSEWDSRHQLHLYEKGRKAGNLRADNSILPVGERLYYSVSETLPELKATLSTIRHSAPLLRALDREEPKQKKNPWSNDCAPTQMPEKHTFGGTMIDRDGKKRMWNDRFVYDIAWMNDILHKNTRQYFVEKSCFEEAPSNYWRRYRSQQVAYGDWVSTQIKKPPIFGTLGV